MDKVKFILCFHAHQPIGNFDWVLEEAYEKSYRPFLDVLERHPRIKSSLHYSGCLLDWFEKNKPEFLKRLKSLVKAGQIEILGGGYYEPILPLIPDDDKTGALRMMRDALKRHFNVTPQGIWLAERVWEPHLAKVLSEEGVRYTIVDDAHFKRAGLEEDKIFGYYVSEEQGATLAIFPTLEKLRYMVPFKLPEVTIDYLRSCQQMRGGSIVIADDTEKFGLWPGTHKWVYEEGWLDSFFKKLEENIAWIETLTFNEHLLRSMPLGRIYLECGSYKEMNEWSGGYFRNFLVKYPESNHLHKKMMYTSERIRRIAQDKKAPRGALAEATRHLYMSQCNDVYWHGVFGGLYYNHLRYAAYHNLLEAEIALDSYERGKEPIVITDFDKDGSDDIIVNTGSLGLLIDLDSGGTIAELDYKPARLNLINTLSRRPEPYHAKLKEPQPAKQNPDGSPATIHEGLRFKENGLAEYLNYDWYRKVSLIDHFMPQDTSHEEFSKCSFKELGDFVDAPYAAKIKTHNKNKAASNIIELSREGGLRDDELQPVSLVKMIELSEEPRLVIKYAIKNTSGKLLKALFGSEFNFSLKDPHFNQVGSVAGVKRIDINDQWFGTRIDLTFDKPAGLFYFPVETVSESESGIERTYQELSFLFNWGLELSPGSTWRVNFSLELGGL